MVRRLAGAVSALFLFSAVYGCSSGTGTPTTPTSFQAAADAAADGSTLKVTAPALLSPVNNVQLDTLSPLFRLQNATAKYTATPALSYRFEVSTPGGTVVGGASVGGGNGTTSWQFPTDLVLDTAYRWRARAEFGTAFGPWSAFGTFRSLDYRGINPRPADGKWPSTPDDLVNYMTESWPEYLEPTALTAQRIANMEFLRDRFIEAGICGGLDLAWNRKRGDFNADRSVDALAWRTGGQVEVVDLAAAFDDKTIPLILHWSIVSGPPGYDRYTNHPGC